jgi:hypothetical protein
MNIVSKMADVPLPGYQTLRTNKLSALKSEYQTLVQQYPEAPRTTETVPSGAG